MTVGLDTIDVIDVSSGSTTSVETDELFLAAATLSALAAGARDWAHQAAMARCITQWSGDAAPFGFAESDLTRSSAVLQDTASDAEGLAWLVESAATSYAAGEERNADVSSLLFALGAFLAGGVAHNLVLGAALPLAPSALLTALVAQHTDGRRVAAVLGEPLAAALVDHGGLLADPAFVSLVRTIVSSADEFALGAAGVAPPLAHLLGDRGAGVVGLGSMAGALLILSGRNAYIAKPVTVSPSAPTAVAPPVSLADAAARIPPSGPGRPQVRIERFDGQAGQASYAVYIAGTSAIADGSPEPFDMASNLAGIAGDDAAAYSATIDAMDEAGIRPGDQVSFVGHSQGGLVAARIAASGAYDTDALVTFGAPTGQIPVPGGVEHLAVEHAEDITPALGGEPLSGAGGRDRVVVSRALFGGAPSPDASPIAAHHMSRYAETAALVDASDDPRLEPVRDALARLGAGASVGSATLYRAERDSS